MLYVFHVDTGRMIKFDMNVALGSVHNLKEIIQRGHGLPAENIVLLVSGGDMLASGKLVCSYSAGTDTNPIFMFSTVDVKSQQPPNIDSSNSDSDLSNQVKRCFSLPANYSTVVIRAQLAQQMYELAREEETVCERLVHEQHLQQQGWSAVIANMEDLTDEFRRRFVNFSNSFEEHLCNRNQYLELMKNFNDDLTNLSMIPILPGLLQHAHHDFHGFDDFLDNDDVFSRSQQNESMIMQSAATTDPTINNDIGNNNSSSKGGIDTAIVSSSSGSGGVEQKRPRLSKENTPDSMSVGSGGGGGGSGKSSSIGSNKGGKSGRSLTLLQWITAKENHHALRTMADECSQGLETFTTEKYEKLKSEVYNIINFAEHEDIKEIKGLESRLCGLEKMMFDLKKFVQDQKELSTAFQQNQNRASNLGDASIFPDLCASHQGQLSHMLNHHLKIRDYRRRVSKAKDELGANLNKRLKYIVNIENTMSNLDNNLLFYHRCLRRLQRHINIIQQIHQTPRIYVAAVTEVVRRRLFSSEFVQWASTLACDFDTIHSEEVKRRREFNTNFEGHFLNTLFPGMNDMPPAFANEHPIIFDASLPNITKKDFDMLSTFLPQITEHIQIPDMGAVIQFFISRSGNKNANEKMVTSTTQKSQSNTGSAVEGIISQRPIDLHAHLKDGFESETDTEEFEKVGQSTNEDKEKLPIQLLTASVSTSTSENKQPETVSASIETETIQTNTVETLTEENLGSRQLEIERLKLLLKNMSQVSYQCLKLLKNNLESIKSDQTTNQNDIQLQLNTLSETWTRVHNEYDSRERFSIEQIKNLHQQEINDLKLNLKKKENELELLKCELNTTESSHKKNINLLQSQCEKFQKLIDNMNKQISVLEEKLKNNDSIKEQAVNEIRDKLMHEHKTEIESLRCRFKLMTSMERSPSDTSLEKIEKPDMIEIAYHESILLQLREDFMNEKKQAIRNTLESEKLKLESCMAAQSLSPASFKAMSANMELLKKMVEEKDKQLDAMRERDLMLSKENCQLKMKIEALTNEDESDKGWLKEKIEFLNRDKNRLEHELGSEKIRRIEMETSIAAMKNSTIDSVMLRSKQGRSTITTDSCNSGDIVFVVWNIRHKQFIVVQETPSLYFVHGDSLHHLNLKLPILGDSEIPVPFYTLARVVHKEYCQARKEENRYKVAKGTKFYRIKLDPLLEFKWHNRRERLESSTTSAIAVNRANATVQQLIDSFAQTENQQALLRANNDLVDSPSTSSSSSAIQLGNLKERTISVNSITEEEDEPIALITDRNRYVSVSEEDERAVNDQPSSLSTDYENLVTTAISTSTTNIVPSGDCRNNNNEDLNISGAINTISSQHLLLNNPEEIMDINTSSLLDSSSNQNDDSDEYRSLETKDDQEFPISTSGGGATSTTSSTIQTISPTPSTDI